MALENDYEVLERLGEGAFGKVYKARHRKTDDLVAVKQIKLGAKSWEEACKSTELAALKTLRHPFIVRLRELIRSQWDGSLYYIFEYIDSDLCRYLRKYPQGLDELKAAELTRQLFAGLTHIHQYNFFHRDIKPENVLYETQREMVRIADFGEARSLRARPPFTDYVGTRWYRAPECLLRDRTYSSLVDVWASGLVFAELLRGQPLFMGSSSIDQLYKIFQVLGQPIQDWPEFTRLAEACRFRVPDQAGCGLQRVLPRSSAHCVSLVSEILVLNPRKRPLARKVLEHSYFLSQLPALDLERIESSRPASLGNGSGNGGYSGPARDAFARPNSFNSAAGSSVAPSAIAEPTAPLQDRDNPRPLSSDSSVVPVVGADSIVRSFSRPATEVQVDDLDLDAELDKILGSASPKRRAAPALSAANAKTAGKSAEVLKEMQQTHSLSSLGLSVSASFSFAPNSRQRAAPTSLFDLETSGLDARDAVKDTACDAPSSPGGLFDSLLNDLCADLGFDDPTQRGHLAESNAQAHRGVGLPSSKKDALTSPQPSDDEPHASGFDASDWDENDASFRPAVVGHTTMKLARGEDVSPAVAGKGSTRLPWTVEESSLLRRIVKKVVKAGNLDKESLWIQVSREMGGRHTPKDCKLQYARDYKAHKASEEASGHR